MLGKNFGIDHLLFKESATAILTSAPVRMAFNTSIIFVIIGVALLLCGFETVLFSYLAQLLVIPAGIIALLSFVGYVYGAKPALYWPEIQHRYGGAYCCIVHNVLYRMSLCQAGAGIDEKCYQR